MSRALGSKLPVTSCETQICASVKSRSLWDFSRSRSSIAFSKNCRENLRVPIARFIQSGQNAANSEIGQKNAHECHHAGTTSAVGESCWRSSLRERQTKKIAG